jgi:hypothetical protein
MEVILNIEPPKSYFMCTESEPDLVSWIDALNSAASSTASSSTPPLSKSNYDSPSASPLRSVSSSYLNSPSRASTIPEGYRCVNALAPSESFDRAIYGPASTMDENARIVLARVWPLPSVCIGVGVGVDNEWMLRTSGC